MPALILPLKVPPPSALLMVSASVPSYFGGVAGLTPAETSVVPQSLLDRSAAFSSRSNSTLPSVTAVVTPAWVSRFCAIRAPMMLPS